MLTDNNGVAHNEHKWKIGEPSAALTYYYPDELVAVFANPIYENLEPASMQLWEFKPEKEIDHDVLRCCCVSGSVIQSITIPSMSLYQRVEIAIKCALEVLGKGEFAVIRKQEYERFKQWAESGKRMTSVVDYNGIAAAGTNGKYVYDGVSRVVKASALCFLANESLHCAGLVDWANQIAGTAKFLAASSVSSIGKDPSGGKYLNVSKQIRSVMFK
jgi:hypothetical protein